MMTSSSFSIMNALAAFTMAASLADVAGASHYQHFGKRDTLMAHNMVSAQNRNKCCCAVRLAENAFVWWWLCSMLARQQHLALCLNSSNTGARDLLADNARRSQQRPQPALSQLLLLPHKLLPRLKRPLTNPLLTLTPVVEVEVEVEAAVAAGEAGAAEVEAAAPLTVVMVVTAAAGGAAMAVTARPLLTAQPLQPAVRPRPAAHSRWRTATLASSSLVTITGPVSDSRCLPFRTDAHQLGHY